eukprot:Nitzschia sp. Nitz4//scaffold32_size149145//108243//109937//NITZ4_002894-RA/size149145-processed-gene-0.133-mRNA-1//-1//CDS//3329548114//8690//frame0
MHQRHVGIVSGTDSNRECLSGNSTKGHPTSAGTFRKRRKGASFSKRRGWKGVPFLDKLDELIDLDLLSSLLQVSAAVIVVGCVLAFLWMFLFGVSSSSDGSDSKSWFSSFDLVNSLKRKNKAEFGRGLNAKYPKDPLRPSSIYTIPGAMSHIGDKSDSYAKLRKEFDAKMHELPSVPQKLHFNAFTENVPYDIYNCPDHPPPGYPYDWILMDVLKNWPPDDTAPRDTIYNGLCVFDYTKDLEKAYNYRNAEVPFVVKNDPSVDAAVRRWNYPTYMERMLGAVKHRAEKSENNHFMYWNAPQRKKKEGKHKLHPDLEEQDRNRHDDHRPQLDRAQPARRAEQDDTKKEESAGWKQPTEMLRMTYREWLAHANVTANTPEEDEALYGPEAPHWYFRLIGCGETGPQGECDNGSSEYLFDELTFFQPRPGGLYLLETENQKGIHCRFGMKGVIAENHFDGSRNSIALMGGERRYILAHPNQCELLTILPRGHPSARHSAIDWSDPDIDRYPEFAAARGNEVVLQPGDVLYLPTNWFHYIISLSLNFQCNTRSGIGQENMQFIHDCGF